MGNTMKDPPSETVHLLERLRAGDRRALAEVFQRHRGRLRRMVELRMDARLQGRVDASDVLQDGFLDLAKRVDSYLSEPKLPVFLWLRLVVSDRLAIYHRRHLGTQMRDAGREVSL
jgi:RNA polymerase sigma-70 factor, ECF subfamily